MSSSLSVVLYCSYSFLSGLKVNLMVFPSYRFILVVFLLQEFSFYIIAVFLLHL